MGGTQSDSRKQDSDSGEGQSSPTSSRPLEFSVISFYRLVDVICPSQVSYAALDGAICTLCAGSVRQYVSKTWSPALHPLHSLHSLTLFMSAET